MAKKQSFFDFFRFSQKLSIRFERNFLQAFYTIVWSFVCNFIKFFLLGCEKPDQNQPKNGQKTAIFRLFLVFAKTVHTIRTKISTVLFYTIVWSMCAISTNSYNWDWTESERKRPKPTPLPHMRLWLILFKRCCLIAVKYTFTFFGRRFSSCSFFRASEVIVFFKQILTFCILVISNFLLL